MASPLDFFFARPLGEGADRLGLPLVVPAILRISVIDTSQMYFEVGMFGQAVGLTIIVYSFGSS